MWALEEELLVPWTWVRTQGEGKVYYTAGGHDLGSIGTPEFQNQLIRAMRWLHPPESDSLPDATTHTVPGIEDGLKYLYKAGTRGNNIKSGAFHF